jgi:hypothetical protein
VDDRFAAHHDHARQIAIGVAHDDRFRRRSPELGRGAHRLDPRERRVPRRVELAPEVRFDLALVVREQHEVERQAGLDEERAEAFPDRDDLRVVGDGSEDEIARHD